MKKKEENVSKVMPDSIGDRRRDEFHNLTFLYVVVMFGAICLAIGLLGYAISERTEKAKSKDQPTIAFIIKGPTTVDTEIDGEVHRLVCCDVRVSEFWSSVEPEKAALIGTDEYFTSLIAPDGVKSYYSTYYEALDDDRGLRVRKTFLDCGTDGDYMVAGYDFPLAIEFELGAAYEFISKDQENRVFIPTVIFD